MKFVLSKTWSDETWLVPCRPSVHSTRNHLNNTIYNQSDFSLVSSQRYFQDDFECLLNQEAVCQVAILDSHISDPPQSIDFRQISSFRQAARAVHDLCPFAILCLRSITYNSFRSTTSWKAGSSVTNVTVKRGHFRWTNIHHKPLKTR